MEAFQVSLDSCYQMLDEHLGYDLRGPAAELEPLRPLGTGPVYFRC